MGYNLRVRRRWFFFRFMLFITATPSPERRRADGGAEPAGTGAGRHGPRQRGTAIPRRRDASSPARGG